MTECQSHDRFCLEVKETYCKIEGKLDMILSSQAARRERCAANEGRMTAMESALERLDREVDQLWTAVNALRKHHYMTMGIGVVLTLLGQIGIGVMIYRLTVGG